MKIFIKNIKNQSFPVEIEGTATIKALKEVIGEQKKHDPAGIKLVHKGKTLNEDTKTLNDCEIKDGEFIVIIVTVPQPSSVPPPPPPPPQVEEAPKPTTTTTNTSSTTGTSSSGTGSGSGGLGLPPNLSVDQYNKMIENLTGMGFEQSQAESCLRAANFNQQIAIEFLFSGIPSGIGSGGFGGLGGLGGLGGMGGGDMDGEDEGDQDYDGDQSGGGLPGIDPSQLEQIRTAIAQDPTALNQLITNLQQSNPVLGALIAQNPAGFLQLLMGGGMPGGAPGGAGGVQISLSPQEGQSIERLMEYGFQEEDALEAFLACDKDQALALNYLFDKQTSGDLLTQFESGPPGGSGGSGSGGSGTGKQN